MSKPDLSVVKDMNKTDVGKTVLEVTTLNKHDIIEIKKATIEALMEYEKRTLDLGGSKLMSEHIKREEFENFKSHIDTKFDNSMKEFREEMRSMRTDINNNMNSIRTEMNTNTNNLRNDMQNSISKLPTNADVKNILLENNKELDREAKQNRNTVIGWLIGFVGLGFTAAKAFGWL